MRMLVLSAVLVLASIGSSRAQDAAAGEAVFKKYVCFACHDAGENAKIKLGPPLNGLDGRKAGSYPGFSYSDGFPTSGITWNADSFKDYIHDPAQKIPGNRMAFAGIKNDTEVDNLWSYLKQFDADGKKK
jgi:cytochrome c